MAPTRTKTVKNKHAANRSGIKNSKDSRRSESNGVVKPRSNKKGGAPPPKQVQKSSLAALLQKRNKKKKWTDEELGIPKLNAITPVGVVKPKGKKKGKVFVDDPESMRTILAIVQAEKEGQIESKLIKARQMEEIREARREEAEKKEEEKKAKLEDTKDSLRKKRKKTKAGSQRGDDSVKDVALTGSKAVKTKVKKRVAFA